MLGKPAARVSDMHVCPMFDGPKPHVGGPVLPTGCPTVIICGMPAARVGDRAMCVGPPDVIAQGSPTVFIGGQLASRMGDMTVHGGVITTGCPTVLIGEMAVVTLGMNKAAGQIAAFKEAAKTGVPFCEVCSARAQNDTPEPPSVETFILAKEQGNTNEHRQARKAVAKHFYETIPGLGPERFRQDIKGIDLSQPVEIVHFPPPDTMSQYVRKNSNKVGSFFDPVGGQSANSLGLSNKGRELKNFKTPNGMGLKSTAAPIVDNWTTPGSEISTEGGGSQIVVGSDMRDKFTQEPD